MKISKNLYLDIIKKIIFNTLAFISNFTYLTNSSYFANSSFWPKLKIVNKIPTISTYFYTCSKRINPFPSYPATSMKLGFSTLANCLTPSTAGQAFGHGKLQTISRTYEIEVKGHRRNDLPKLS